MKEEIRKENARFRSMCNELTPIIILIYVILVVVAMIIDVVENKEIGFVVKFPGVITLVVMGVITLAYWLPKFIIIVIKCLNVDKEY